MAYIHQPFANLLALLEANPSLTHFAMVEDDFLDAFYSLGGLGDNNTKGDFFEGLMRQLVRNRSDGVVTKSACDGYTHKNYQLDLVAGAPVDGVWRPYVLGEAKVLSAVERSSSSEIDKRLADMTPVAMDTKMLHGGQKIVLDPQGDPTLGSGFRGVRPHYYGFVACRVRNASDATTIRRKVDERRYFLDGVGLYLFGLNSDGTGYSAVDIGTGTSLDEVIDLFVASMP